MQPHSEEIAHCHSCGAAMTVTALPPFSDVVCPHCGVDTRVKCEFGPYLLVRRFAIGGMSVVFLARDTTLDREVIVKILNEQYSSDEKRIAAFEEEARLTASFSHPHVVRVYTTGKAFGRFYIAMELVPGGHLEQQIQERGTLPESEMLPLAIQVVEGLKAAKSAGLIHRDIKPGNILLGAEGRAKIVDFGLALVTKGGVAQAQEIWATPYYVPPETIEGQPEDFRSDIYAFGATLYHALAGKPPCDEESMATDVLRAAKRKVQPLHHLAPWLSAATCAVVDRAMAYEPANRFQSYEELIAGLQRALQQSSLGASPASEASPSAERETKRRRFRFAVAGGVAALLLSVAGWALLRNGSAPETAQQQEETPVAPPAGGTGSETAPPKVSDIASRYRAARSALGSRDYETARQRFAGLRDDPEVKEPTRSWVGMEAILAGYLKGSSTAARKETLALIAMAQETDGEGSPLGELMVPFLRQLGNFPPVPLAEAAEEPLDAEQVACRMLGALKNWEQGYLNQAADCFRTIENVSLSPPDERVILYQALARDYLADFSLLSDPVFDDFPNTPEACQQAMEKLEAMLPQIKTEGRARFNIQAWKDDLARHRTRLENMLPGPPAGAETGPAAPSREEILSHLSSLCTAYQFGEATRYLQETESAELQETTLPLRYLTQSAAALLRLLGDPPAQGWSRLSSQEIFQRYQAAVSQQTDASTRLQLHEGAIAFEWLVGDRERARAAAENLAKTQPEFRQRWQDISPKLPP